MTYSRPLPDPLPVATYDVIVGGTVVCSYPYEVQRRAAHGNPACRRADMHAQVVGGTVKIGWPLR